MSLVLSVEILGEFRKLTQATQGAESSLSKMNKNVSKFSSFMKSSLATIGVGFSLAMVIRELKDASKAAVEDAKSAGQLKLALQNVTGASDKQVASVEKSIAAMSLQAAVADDKIRPAFAQLVRATGDVAKSTDLMKLALDVAAGTGKDVEAVSKAIAKAVGPDGTTGALEKLVPAIKGASDPMGVLSDMFAGAAANAANLDPYQRMQIAFGEIQESVGSILLPVLEDFATWLVDVVPTVQNFFAELTDPTTEMGAKWQGMIDVMILTGNQFNKLMDIFSGGKGSTSMVMDWITSITAGLGQIMFYLSRLAIGWNAFWEGDFGAVIENGKTFAKDYQAFVQSQNAALIKSQYTLPGKTNPSTGFTGNITINTYNSNVTANDIVTTLNKSLKANGSLGLAY